MPRRIKDPSNLSSLLLSNAETSENDFVEPYVNPHLELATFSVKHGRGLIARETIKAGSCLFVMSPAVSAAAYQVKERFFATVGPKTLEEVAEDVLVESMEQVADTGIQNSFLALLGAANSLVDKEPVTTVDVLIGKDSKKANMQVTCGELRQIIRRNGRYIFEQD
jgi:hypothetical protein